MKKSLIAFVLAMVLGGGYTISAFAQTKPDVLVRQRQSAMVLIGKYFGPLGLMNAGKLPYNADVVARNAVLLDALSQMPWDGFTEDTKGEKSRAVRPDGAIRKAKPKATTPCLVWLPTTKKSTGPALSSAPPTSPK